MVERFSIPTGDESWTWMVRETDYAALKVENEQLRSALAERAGGVNEDALRALAQAYDREDAAQRGEPDPEPPAPDPTPVDDDISRIYEDHEPAVPEGPRRCATEGCDQPATNEFIRGDVGSFYCGDCFGKVIEACETLSRPTEQAVTEALRDLLAHVDRNACTHESTHRGGVIWTICDECGQKWADDRGGFVPYSDPEPVANARAALKAAMEAGRYE